MQIRTLSEAPFVVDVLPFRRVAHQWQLAVVCKATYDIEANGEVTSRPARDAVPVLADEVHDGPRLYAPRDLVPCKARPEIVVVGVGPGARLSVDGACVDAVIEPPRAPGEQVTSRATSKRWHVTQLASEPLGADFDEATFQFAPPQLQLARLPLDHPIVIDDGDGGRLSLVFPDRAPVAHLESLETTSRPVMMVAELMWIDVIERRCTVTWRGVTETALDPNLGLRVGVVEGGKTKWPSVRARTHTASSLQTSYEQAHGELPTAVLDSFFDGGGAPAPPSSSRTFAGPLPGADHHPAWLAPAASPPTAPATNQAPTNRPRPPSPPPRPPAPPRPSTPPVRRGGQARASAPPLPSGPPRPSGPPPPPPRHPSTNPPSGPVPTPAPVWSAEPRPEVAAPIAPNPARRLIAESRQAQPSHGATPEPKPERGAPAVPRRVMDVVWTSERCEDVIENDRGLAIAAADASRQSDDADGDPIVGVLRNAKPTPVEDLAHRLMAAMRRRDSLKPVAALIEGDLELRFDPRRELSVYADAARPLARSDKKLAAALQDIDELLQTPLAAVPDVAQGQRIRIVDQWQRANRELPRDFLHRSARDLLLQQRAFDTRDIMGDEHVRAILSGEQRHGGDGQKVPVYFPAAAKKRLPLIRRMPVRCLVELLPRQDERESHPVALIVVALGRIVSLGKG